MNRRRCLYQQGKVWHLREHFRHVRNPFEVAFRRIGPKPLDSDNLVISFKHIRDKIAEVYGTDDADWKPDAKLAWIVPTQEVHERYGVIVQVTGRLFDWKGFKAEWKSFSY